MEYFTFYFSSLGPLVLSSDGRSLLSLRFSGSPPEGAQFSPDHPVWKPLFSWLDLYFSGKDPGSLPLPLAPAGTAFQKQVWTLLLQIPYGQTTTYGALAKRLPNPRMSPQAVGGAVGKNPIALLIPCHRVLGAGNQLTGYAYGIHIKRSLLLLEQGSF